MLKEFGNPLDGKLIKFLDLRIWLLGLGASLIGLHLLVLWRADQPESFNTSLLLYLALGSLLWDKRQKIWWRSSAFATGLGLFLIGFVLVRNYSPDGYQPVVSPLFSGLGVFMLASGIKHLRDYWRELLILTLPIISQVFEFLLELIDLPTLTAKLATYLLWLAGFQVERQGVFIMQPTGTVEVYAACSGISSVIQMLNLAVVFFLLFRTTSFQKILCLILAILIGFFTNSIRVAIMALLVVFSNTQSFDYWHGGQGSLIFSVISTLLFVAFCWFAILRQPAQDAAFDD
jgi:cyanoexosortase A